VARPTTRRSLAAAIAAAAGALAAPAGAGAAVLQPLNDQCFKPGDSVRIQGDGFTAGAMVTVRVTEGPVAQKVADPTGRVVVRVAAPPVTGDAVAPRSFTVTATDGSNPDNVAPAISMFVTRTRPASNAPVEGNPNAATTWEFANFRPGRWIYGHFRFKGTTQRTVRFGRAGDPPCGQLRVRARRVPVPRLHAGRWRLQIDQRKAYSIRTKPRFVVKFSLMRSPRLGG
jgi:hypothetical protein